MSPIQSDGKLAIKMIHHLHHIAKEEEIQLRRTYVKEIKGHRISLRFFKTSQRRSKKPRAAMKRLKDYHRYPHSEIFQ